MSDEKFNKFFRVNEHCAVLYTTETEAVGYGVLEEPIIIIENKFKNQRTTIGLKLSTFQKISTFILSNQETTKLLYEENE